MPDYRDVVEQVRLGQKACPQCGVKSEGHDWLNCDDDPRPTEQDAQQEGHE